MQEYIKKEDLKDFCVYYCNARNFSFGIWYDGKMYGIRYKFGDRYIDTEYHWDDGAENCGTCKPLIQITSALNDRIHPSFFDMRNWRGHTVLQDILTPFNAIIIDSLKPLQDNLNKEV